MRATIRSLWVLVNESVSFVRHLSTSSFCRHSLSAFLCDEVSQGDSLFGLHVPLPVACGAIEDVDLELAHSPCTSEPRPSRRRAFAAAVCPGQPGASGGAHQRVAPHDTGADRVLGH